MTPDPTLAERVSIERFLPDGYVVLAELVLPGHLGVRVEVAAPDGSLGHVVLRDEGGGPFLLVRRDDRVVRLDVRGDEGWVPLVERDRYGNGTERGYRTLTPDLLHWGTTNAVIAEVVALVPELRAHPTALRALRDLEGPDAAPVVEAARHPEVAPGPGVEEALRFLRAVLSGAPVEWASRRVEVALA